MVQKDLDEIPNGNLSVYAVWLPMLPGDARSKWNEGLLKDSRVEHFWDAGAKVVGRWFRDHVEELHREKAPGADHMQGAFGNQRAAWDAYFLYGPDAKWDSTPQPIVSWGRPVFRTEERLREDLQALLKEQ